MILNGKALEDFEKWYLKMLREKPDIQDRYWDENLLSFFWNSDDTIRNARIIEWFDSIDFHCNAIRYNIEYWQPLCVYVMHEKFKTRQEATAKAIEKANEIYNDRPI